MLDIEVVKWGCEFSDGFEWDNNYSILTLPNKKCYKIIGAYTFECVPNYDSVYYPLFLQRVIEGINILQKYMINIIPVEDSGNSVAWIAEIKGKIEWISEDIFLDPDQEKEQAIKYIYDQQITKP